MVIASDGNDDEFTKTYTTATMTNEELLAELERSIVKIVFIKVSDNTERTIYGTQNEMFIPAEKHPKNKKQQDQGENTDDETAASKAEENRNWIRMFDTKIQEWRSCRFENIKEIKVKDEKPQMKKSDSKEKTNAKPISQRTGKPRIRHVLSYSPQELRAIGWRNGEAYFSHSHKRMAPYVSGHDSDSDESYEYVPEGTGCQLQAPR